MMIAANILCDLLYIGSIEAWPEYIAVEILRAVHKINRVGIKYLALALELERLTDGSMPCDREWPEEQVALFRRWVEAGMPA